MPLKLSTRAKLTIATVLNRLVLGSRSLFGKPAVGEFVRNGLTYRLDLHEGIDFAVYLFGIYEKELTTAFARLLKPGDVVIDAGANVGIHTLKLAQLVSPGGKVLAFEPTLYAFEKLSENLRLNPGLAGTVEPHRAFLLSSATVETPDQIYSSWPLSSVGESHPSHGGSLKSTTGAASIHLDSFLSPELAARVKLIKLDVDGFELEVLRGGDKLITENQPLIIVELCQEVADEHGHSVADILAFLIDRGYEFATLQQSPLGQDVSKIIAGIPANGGINVLASPRLPRNS